MLNLVGNGCRADCGDAAFGGDLIEGSDFELPPGRLLFPRVRNGVSQPISDLHAASVRCLAQPLPI
jgi:hypothetical protein